MLCNIFSERLLVSLDSHLVQSQNMSLLSGGPTHDQVVVHHVLHSLLVLLVGLAEPGLSIFAKIFECRSQSLALRDVLRSMGLLFKNELLVSFELVNVVGVVGFILDEHRVAQLELPNDCRLEEVLTKSVTE